MELLVVIFAGISVSLLIFICFLTKQRKLEQNKYEENNQMLTEYVAANLDMEKKLEQMSQDYAKQQDMEKEIRNMQEQSRLLKHDMKNHTLVILSYLEEGRLEEAKTYTSDILDKLNMMYSYVNVGNALLNYIINNKLSRAKEVGLEIKAEIENLAFSYMDSVDFSALLNNLLDNAIEAAQNSKVKKLEVVIAKQKGYDVITVKNTIDASVLENNPDFVTTKQEEGHGFGMKQILNITDKYEGMLDTYEKNGFFIIGVMFLENEPNEQYHVGNYEVTEQLRMLFVTDIYRLSHRH